MNPVILERALTAWFAERLGRTVDTDLFRGGIPDGRQGIAVVFGAEIRDRTVKAKEYEITVYGKFPDRDEALTLSAAVSDLVPVYHLDCGDTHFRALLPRGGSVPFRKIDDGRSFWFVSCNLLLVC